MGTAAEQAHEFWHGPGCISVASVGFVQACMAGSFAVSLQLRKSKVVKLVWVTAAEQARCILAWARLHHADVGFVQACMAGNVCVHSQAEKAHKCKTGLGDSTRAGHLHFGVGQAASCQWWICAGMYGWQLLRTLTSRESPQV